MTRVRANLNPNPDPNPNPNPNANPNPNPNQAAVMDPQQRLLLEHGYQVTPAPNRYPFHYPIPNLRQPYSSHYPYPYPNPRRSTARDTRRPR